MFDLVPRNGQGFLNHFFGDDFYRVMDEPRSMSTDIKETDDGYAISMNIPGYEKGDIEISAKSDVLTISAEKKQETEEKTDNYLRRERFFGRRERCFSLRGIDQDSIDASYENGVLVINLKKDEKALTDKTIEIK